MIISGAYQIVGTELKYQWMLLVHGCLLVWLKMKSVSKQKQKNVSTGIVIEYLTISHNRINWMAQYHLRTRFDAHIITSEF